MPERQLPLWSRRKAYCSRTPHHFIHSPCKHRPMLWCSYICHPPPAKSRLVMRDCGGGSLEAVGNKIKERSAVVRRVDYWEVSWGGKLTLYIYSYMLQLNWSTFLDSSRSYPSAHQLDHSSCNQTFQYPSFIGMGRQIVTLTFLESSLILNSGPLRTFRYMAVNCNVIPYWLVFSNLNSRLLPCRKRSSAKNTLSGQECGPGDSPCLNLSRTDFRSLTPLPSWPI